MPWRVQPPSVTRLREHDCREKVRPGSGREAGLGHAGGSAMHGAIVERRPGIQLFVFKLLLDDSLRSPCGPPSGRSTRVALLSGIRRNDER